MIITLQQIRLKAILFVSIGLMACSSLTQRTNDPTHFTTWVAHNSHTPIVAILPFYNKTTKAELADLVRAGFYGHFSSLAFADRELGEIDRSLEFLEKHQKRKFYELGTRELGSLLGAQALVYGDVTSNPKFYAGVYSQIGVGAKIKIVDVQTEMTLWEDSYTTRFHEASIPMNQILVVFSLAKTLMNLRGTQELRTIDDLCRNLVSRIPTVAFPETYDSPSPYFCEIQIGAFKDLARAQELQKRLQKKNYEAFIRTIEDRGVTWHRVLVGPFDCGQQTDTLKEKLATEFGCDPVPLKIEASRQLTNSINRKEE